MSVHVGIEPVRGPVWGKAWGRGWFVVRYRVEVPGVYATGGFRERHTRRSATGYARRLRRKLLKREQSERCNAEMRAFAAALTSGPLCNPEGI